ncbi:MAG: carboxypeptidase regulatory-like domain-containing protein [Acidobacteria bacterium]|nr:carboxypeptidase regulatory-like domain-containing protein [Acidobacteriota bacterium]MBK7934601.1 carboxypeptidase regulatory-like domain-containing protein [Acidobacteriota bacterium]
MSVLSFCGGRRPRVDSDLKAMVSRYSRFAGVVAVLALFLSVISTPILANTANFGSEVISGPSNMTLPVEVSAPTMGHPAAILTIPVPISVQSVTGDNIIAFQFNILYDPAMMNPFGPNFGCSTAGTISAAAGQSATCNVIIGEEGRLRVSVSGANALNGMGPVLNVTFQRVVAAPPPWSSPLTFEPGTVFFFRGGPMAGPVPVNVTNGQVTLLPPTSATAAISGRVTTSTGRGVQNAIMTITGGGLTSPRSARTGSFGYFSIDDLLVGETYVVTVNSKRYAFQTPSRIISLTDSVTDADFVADPEQ